VSDFIKAYLDYTEMQESPPAFHYWTAITIISAALKRQVWLERGFKALRLYPNTYIMIVGPPGRQKKSTAIKLGIDLLYEADPSVQIFQERMTPEGVMLAMNRVNANMAAQSLNMESSLLLVASELTTMFGADQSQAGRMISFMTRWYDCPDIFPYLTATHGKLEFFNLYPTFLGATPETMLNIIPAEARGGLLSRMIFIHSNDRKRIPRPRAGPGYSALIDQLKQIANMKGVFTETKSAQDYFDEWYMTIPDEADDRAATFMERLPDHVLKMACILAASRDTMTIDVKLMDAAIQVMVEVIPGVRHILAHVGASDFAQLTMRILSQITSYGPFAKIQIYTANSFTASVEEIDQAVADLVERRLIKETFVGSVPTYQSI
jgi:hypothetical protein